MTLLPGISHLVMDTAPVPPNSSSCLCSTRSVGSVPRTYLDTGDTSACHDQEGEAWIGRSMLRSATLADCAEPCLHPSEEPSLCEVQQDLESKASQRSTEQSVPAEQGFKIAW